MYAGEDCAFALHDALLEDGKPGLARHFMTPEHPRGCKYLDLILGKRYVAGPKQRELLLHLGKLGIPMSACRVSERRRIRSSRRQATTRSGT